MATASTATRIRILALAALLTALAAGCGGGARHLASSGSASQLDLCVATWNRPGNYLRPAMAALTHGTTDTDQRASVQYDERRHICVYSVRWYENGGGAFGGDYWVQDLIANPGRSDFALRGPDVVLGTFSAEDDDPDYEIPTSNASIARNGALTLTNP
jgi:hypothetical protein